MYSNWRQTFRPQSASDPDFPPKLGTNPPSRPAISGCARGSRTLNLASYYCTNVQADEVRIRPLPLPVVFVMNSELCDFRVTKIRVRRSRFWITVRCVHANDLSVYLWWSRVYLAIKTDCSRLCVRALSSLKRLMMVRFKSLHSARTQGATDLRQIKCTFRK